MLETDWKDISLDGTINDGCNGSLLSLESVVEDHRHFRILFTVRYCVITLQIFAHLFRSICRSYPAMSYAKHVFRRCQIY